MGPCDCRGASSLKNFDGHMVCEPVVIKSCEPVVCGRVAGGLFNGYLARPQGAGLFPAIVLVHDVKGWTFGVKEMARRLAYHGFACLVPNLHFAADKCTAEQNAEFMAAQGLPLPDVMLGFLKASHSWLQNAPFTSGKVGVLGLSDGGTKAWLGACKLPFDAVACCYSNPAVEETAGLAGPFLGLFGDDDPVPSADAAEALQNALASEGKPHQILSYKGAGHDFMAPERQSFKPDAAADAWDRIIDFFGYFTGPKDSMSMPSAETKLISKSHGNLVSMPKDAAALFCKPHAKPLWKLFTAADRHGEGKVSKDALMDAIRDLEDVREELGFPAEIPDTFFDDLFQDTPDDEPSLAFAELEKFYGGMHNGLTALKDAATSTDLDNIDRALADGKALGLSGSKEYADALRNRAKVQEALAADAFRKQKELAMAALKDATNSGDMDALATAIEKAKKLGLADTSAYNAAVKAKALGDLVEAVNPAAVGSVGKSRGLAAEGAADRGLDLEGLGDEGAGLGETEKLEAVIETAKKLGLTDAPEFDAARRKKNKLRKPKARDPASYTGDQGDKLWDLFTECDKADLGKISKKALLDELAANPDRWDPLGFPDNIADLLDDLFKDAASDKDPVLTYPDLEQFYEGLHAAIKALKDATGSGDVDALEAAIDKAKLLGLTGNKDFDAARAKRAKRMQELKAESEQQGKDNALKALRDAVASGDLAELEEALANAKSLGLRDSSEYEAARLKKGELARPPSKADRSYSDDQGGLLWQLYYKCDKEDAGKIGKDALLAGLRENPDLKTGLELPDDLSELAGFDDLFKDAALDQDPVLTYDALEDWYNTLHAGVKGLRDAAATDDMDAIEEAMDTAWALGLGGSKAYEDARSKRAALRKPAPKPDRAYEPEMHDKLWDLFTSCDEEDLDKISSDALVKGLQQPETRAELGLPDEFSPLLIADLFKDAEDLSTPILSFDGLEDWYNKMTKGKKAMPLDWPEATEVLKEFFHKCDADDSKTISKAEFLGGLPGSDEARKLLGLSEHIEWKDLDELWLTMDADQSGELSYDELFQYYVNYWQTLANPPDAARESSNLGTLLKSMRGKPAAALPTLSAIKEDAPDPVEFMMKEWTAASRQAYDDNLQMYDENLLKAEKASGNLKKQNLASIKGKANVNALFEALPKIAEAIDRLNRGVQGTHDFLHAAFDNSDRIRRLKNLISAGEAFEAEHVEWSVLLLMKQDPENAGEQARVRIVNRLIKLYDSVTTIIYDHRGSRTSSFDIRTVEESGITKKANVALVSLRKMRASHSFTGQARSVFDSNIASLDLHLPPAQELTDALLAKPLAKRNKLKGRKQTLELFEHVAQVRDAMANLAMGEHELLISAFGGTSRRVLKLKALMTGGTEDFDHPIGGILQLMAEDPVHIGEKAHQKTMVSLKASYDAAAGVAADAWVAPDHA